MGKVTPQTASGSQHGLGGSEEEAKPLDKAAYIARVKSVMPSQKAQRVANR